MQEENTNNEEESKKPSGVLVDKATETFKWWNNLATLNEEDSIGMSLLKISFRIIGIIVIVAISPIAFIMLIIAFMAVI